MRRSKPNVKKESTLGEIRERLDRANVFIVADYRGLSVTQISQLRSQLAGANVELRVAKNTLVRLAARQLGLPELGDVLEGPTAVAFGFGDEPVAAKTLSDFATTSKILKIKGGLLGKRAMRAEDVASLATSPSKPQLFAQVLGTLQSPAASVLGLLNGPSRSLLMLLQRRAEQLETQGA